MDEEKQSPSEGREATAPEAPAPEHPAPRTSGLAIASLVLAILGLVTWVTALVGLVLGIIAMVQIGRTPQKLRGMGVAIAGTVIGGIEFFLMPIVAAILVPVFFMARGNAQKALCMTNVKQLCMAMQQYATDYGGKYPTAENWNDTLQSYVKNPNVLICPAEKSGKPAYAMNAQLSGFPKSDVKLISSTVMIFESAPGKDQAGGPDILPSPPRHLGEHVVGFADGHAQADHAWRVRNMNWDPRSTSPSQSEEPEPPPSGG
ncbi:MAG TPA: DUF4190 domain-containing protein [Armatimonadota bacterium]|nr:DUF4190 domain-containing protein [Armatimonadota bacterium]